MARSLKLTEDQLTEMLRRNRKYAGDAPAAGKPKLTLPPVPKPQKRVAVPSRKLARLNEAEEQLAFQIRAAKLPEPVRQWRFAPPRRFRADFGWPWGAGDQAMPLGAVAVEIEGGIFMHGKSGHSSGTGILRDMEKGNEYALRGIRCLRVTPEQVKSGQALALIERLLSQS